MVTIGLRQRLLTNSSPWRITQCPTSILSLHPDLDFLQLQSISFLHTVLRLVYYFFFLNSLQRSSETHKHPNYLVYWMEFLLCVKTNNPLVNQQTVACVNTDFNVIHCHQWFSVVQPSLQSRFVHTSIYIILSKKCQA